MPAVARLAALVAAALSVACGGEPLLARGSGVHLATAEVQARLDSMPPAGRARLATIDARRAWVEDLVVAELVVREAERAARAPATPDAAGKRRMVQEYLLERFGSAEAANEIPEAELRREYEEHRAEFVQPVRQGALELFFPAPAGSAERAAREAAARRAHARIVREERPDPDSTEVFERIAVEVVRASPGRAEVTDLGPLSRDQLAARLGPANADLIWDGVGNRTSEVLATERGFHVVKFRGGLPAVNRTFDEVRELLAERLHRARSARAYQDWIADLRRQAAAAIVDAEVARLTVPAEVAGAPEAAPPGPEALSARAVKP